MAECTARVSTIAALLMMTCGICFAEDSPGLPPALQACANLHNDGERLACYDRLVAQTAAGNAPTEEQVAQAPQEMFGMRGDVSRKSAPEAAPRREELSSITAHVQALKASASGALIIELDNGQVWRQEDSAQLMLEVGDSVTITRGALKSFRLATTAHRAGRVQRIR